MYLCSGQRDIPDNNEHNSPYVFFILEAFLALFKFPSHTYLTPASIQPTERDQSSAELGSCACVLEIVVLQT